MTYKEFFGKAYGRETDPGFGPYDYQAKLAQGDWPDLLDVPTGMGKTAAVTLAWLYRRQVLKQTEMPRRLVWCLPMRVLVEQTEENIRGWLKNLGIHGEAGEGRVSVHVLMGGESDLKRWADHPEEDMILLGTQDMLLSRALMRGYGMSRYQWPVHFALLHNDCQWVFDEVQLMGAGLTTSTQLEAFRRDLPLAKSSRSLWVSATLNQQWLDTIDLRPHLPALRRQTIDEADRRQAGERLGAIKSVTRSDVRLTREAGNKTGMSSYLEALAASVLGAHDDAAQTLVIVNRVERAQRLYRLIREARPHRSDLLIHARFRPTEREARNRRLRDESSVDRILIATQAVEAGVDLSSKLLVTELAPWSSLAQRFGRCNRYGEHNATGGARILWVDFDEDADALPYPPDALAAARDKLRDLHSASPEHLPATDELRPLSMTLRRKDLLDLFNTDPDLSGFDVDVSDYIRDRETPGVLVFWRDFEDPNVPEPQGGARRPELCPISITQARSLGKRDAWFWDPLVERWAKLERSARPGMTLLLRAQDGGYDDEIGFDAGMKQPVVMVLPPPQAATGDEAFGGDALTRIGQWISLPKHLLDATAAAADLCDRLAIDELQSAAIIRAARWHDVGKAHDAFQNALKKQGEPPDAERIWAKAGGTGRLDYCALRDGVPMQRRFFRHELASMLAWLDQHDGEPEADLVAYLILAHHGKVRMSLRALPTEQAPRDVKRFARGIWEGDVLPAVDFAGERSEATTLRLALMEIGYGEQGSSWTERSLNLLERHGPFELAWLETLVRLADWRASTVERKPL